MLDKLKLGNLNDMINKYSDLVLAGLVVVVLALVIIPLPTWLNDILLTIDITLSILIILVALYISDALKIASFPTILLITTLYRLSTQHCLHHVSSFPKGSGRSHHAFGNFVVGGNYVVGGILF
ncbi:MAG: FHIPEP family type III secretion protein [bacterium]